MSDWAASLKEVKFSALDLGDGVPDPVRHAIPVVQPREHAILHDGEGVLLAFETEDGKRLTLLLSPEMLHGTYSEVQKIAVQLDAVQTGNSPSTAKAFVTERFAVTPSDFSDSVILEFESKVDEHRTTLSRAGAEAMYRQLGNYLGFK